MSKKTTTSAAVALPRTHRALSAVFLINSAVFGKETPARQTAILAEAKTPVKFVENFTTLTNPLTIRDKLLKGADVSLELEFNSLVLTAEEMTALRAIQPILAKIQSIGPDYPWLDNKDYTSTIEFKGDFIVRSGYQLRLTLAKRLWERASKYWGGGNRCPGELYELIEGQGRKYIYTSKTDISIGCQTISRSEVEWIARTLGWQPAVPAAK